MPPLKYLTGYPESLILQARKLLDQGKLGAALLSRYSAGAHGVRTDRALYQYVTDLKNTYMRNGDQINKVAFDSKIHVIQHALGQHTYISRVQAASSKAKHEIRVATLFKTVPAEFLKMITVHELAHLKEKDHNKAFLQHVPAHGTELSPVRVRPAPLPHAPGSDAATCGIRRRMPTRRIWHRPENRLIVGRIQNRNPE